MQFLKYKPQRILPALLLLLFIACNGVRESDLQHLQGYWEIQSVTFPDGVQKEYTANTTIDYYEVQEGKGFRKKMHPTLDGTYRTSDDALPMQVLFEEGRVLLSFDGGTQQWQEEILELNPSRLVCRHENGLKYAYIRFEPLTLPEDAQK